MKSQRLRELVVADVAVAAEFVQAPWPMPDLPCVVVETVPAAPPVPFVTTSWLDVAEPGLARRCRAASSALKVTL